MAQGPSFRCFDGDVDEWQAFREQLEQYFVACDVKEEEKKKAVLINHCEPKTYKLLRDLCMPKVPSAKKYDELCDLFAKHFTPPVIVHKERRLFWRATRGTDPPESVNAWAARVKNLASNCKMGDHLQHSLVDKFVDGLEGKAYERICEEDEKLTLEKALEIAVKYEPEEPRQSSLFQFQRGKHPAQRGRSVPEQKTAGTDAGRCLVCNKPGHLADSCRYKNYQCRKCHAKGHLQAACPVKRNYFLGDQRDGSGVAEGASDAINLEQNFISKWEFNSIHWVEEKLAVDRPMTLGVRVGKQNHVMQLDTGAAISAVSLAYYDENLRDCVLRQSSLKLSGYGGENLVVRGVIEPDLVYAGARKRVAFAVIENGGPPLLGRNFVRAFNLGVSSLYSVEADAESVVQSMVSSHAELFSEGLGTFKYGTIKLELEEDARPIFRKPRTVAYKFVDKVAEELDTMERDGVISKCDRSSWGTPLVPVIKADGSIRLCGDYKTTVNMHVKDVIHPLPTVDEVFSKLNGGKRFSKLDLSKCYNQFVLDEESREVCAISTGKGVYKMNRLPFGIRPASGIVQRIIEQLLCGIPGVQNFLDDVLVTGRTDREHLENLAKVFDVLEQAGLKLNLKKCQFFKKEVTYLGHVISANGLCKTDERVKAIRMTKEPKNVQEVRAFAGLVNHYSRFVKNIADMMSPLYRLLKKGTKFVWSSECREAFVKVKDAICEDVMLAHFDPNAKLLLVCDASMEGVAAVLVQKAGNEPERPVAFASRVLHAAERNYSVLDREGLAIMFGLNKFFHYLVGNTFTIRTDHKPLISILNPHKGIPAIAASRMQRWANFLGGFSYRIEHVNSEGNIADYPSRAPFESWTLWKEDDTYLNFINTGQAKVINDDVVRVEIGNDPELAGLRECLLNGRRPSDPKASPYRKVFNELSLENGLIMRGVQVVVPTALRKAVLEQAHRSHMGIGKCKTVMRSFVWWPGVDNDLETHVKSCKACLVNRPSPEKAKLIPWEAPKSVWSRVHLDFAGPVKGWSFLIVVDALSKWVEVFPTQKCDTEFVLEKLAECIARFGLMHEIVSDNGTQFTSAKFRSFLEANGVRLVLTSPGHPATNGQAENSVKTFKASLLKSFASGSTNVKEIVANFLLGYRSATHCSTGTSPAQLMLGRQPRSTLDLLRSNDRGVPSKEVKKAREAIVARQSRQVDNYKGTREQRFNLNERVMVRDYTNPNKAAWTPAVVTAIVGKRNYVVKLSSGREIKRHLNQMLADTTVAPEGGEGGIKLGDKAMSDVPPRPKEQPGVTVYRAPFKRVVELFANEERVDPVYDVSGTSPTPEEVELQPEVPAVADTEEQRGDLALVPTDEDDEHFVDARLNGTDSEDSDTGLELAGFDRGKWKFRDDLGRLLRK
ncbi:uncharacterized protein K02A2.6-like [Culex quinquefasciatus]|uniref:uncharacterized protein K02A2.6-like n=1 Tax=Culex quinquefasciatus TaxID=7176 RepID=UPI0018E2A8AF|nr:uncharacterized protein K02A2.6-like [Culex quinquefasciatus]